MAAEKYYSNKILSQKEYRLEKRRHVTCLSSFVSSSSDDSDADTTEYPSQLQTIGSINSSTLNDNGLRDYTADEHDHIEENSADEDNSSPLFANSSFSVRAATLSIMEFVIHANLDKTHTTKLFKLIKSFLPQPNILPISHKNVLKVFGRTSTFTTKYLCENCGNDVITFEGGVKRCSNTSCLYSNRNLVNNRLTEIVTMDIRSGIHSIIKHNIKLLLMNKNMYPVSDIINSSYYLNNNKANKERTLTLTLHADGAPLIRSSHQSLWPLFANIVEIPPPCREYQRNILILALWSSRKKPDIDAFLNAVLAQLKTLMEHGTTIFIDNQEYRFFVRVQGFIADLPAKSLFFKTINFNGNNACTWCLAPGEYNNNNRVMLYPYDKNNNKPRTHDEFVQHAQLAAFENAQTTTHEVLVNGVRGVSPLLSIIRYPICVLYDYMHLVCLNHVKTLVKRWQAPAQSIDSSLVDNRLSIQRLPRNIKVRFDFSITEVFHWKAKHGRLFILYIGLPILIDILPSSQLFHFAVYALAIKLLHAPENESEISLAEQLLDFYCQSSSLVYDSTIQLYSLHAHLHLAEQVRYHGGLSYTSAFAFESCIRYTKKKAHGTRNLASQISYWTDMTSIIGQPQVTIKEAHGVDEILFESLLLDDFRSKLTELLGIQKVKFYKRFKLPFITFHSTLYDQSFKCVSHIISYKHDTEDRILYGDCIVFIELDGNHYVLINQYREAAPSDRLSSFLEIRAHNSCKIDILLDRLYSMQTKTDHFGILSMSRIRHKCISIPFKNHFCLTEIRNDFEHD